MAVSKKKIVKQRIQPKKSIPVNALIPIKTIPGSADEESLYDIYPSWRFYSYNSSDEWTISKTYCGDIWWEELLPRLREFETMKWKEILKDNKHNHFIDVNKLNPVAINRLNDMPIEAASLLSLRITGTHRVYGFFQGNHFHILWFDKNHGDNNTCVCKSKKRNT